MSTAADRSAKSPELTGQIREAIAALDALLADATLKVRERVSSKGRVDGTIFDREQRATHGLAWLATYVEAVRQLAAYAERMSGAGKLGETEDLLVRVGLGEYLAQVFGGIPMSQGEVVRLTDLGVTPAQVAARMTPAVESFMTSGNTTDRRARLIALMRMHQDRKSTRLNSSHS